MEQEIKKNDLIKLDETVYEIPREFRKDMQVPARVFANETILDDILEDRSLWQLANVATLPGIAKRALAMPDIHQGYGFPIGGVAATIIDQGGVISPGGIGYDINCGVRLLAVNMTADELKPYLPTLADELFNRVPSGVGQGGKIKLSLGELDNVIKGGAPYMLSKGYGTQGDIDRCEENGCMPDADPRSISEHAKKRGADQLGTLGSGNHFLEVQRVDEIFDAQSAQAYGLKTNQVVVMIHCGSRGLGHQVCTDYVRLMMPKVKEWGIELPDRELVCAPFKTREAQEYFSAMKGAANFAWANRHVIGHWVREAFEAAVGKDAKVSMVYDLSHNMGKLETHLLNDKPTQMLVHRKGATRAFPAGHPEIPVAYRAVGHPVLIPGTMGTASYVLVGTEEGMDVAFGSSCHGAGRRLSRTKAKHTIRGTELRKELEAQGILIRCDSDAGLSEEAPIAYKDVEDVVDVVIKSKIARKVVRLTPLAVIKGG